MSIQMFPFAGPRVDRPPRYRSTGFATGYLADEQGVGIAGTTGTFSLWRDETLIVGERQMDAAPAIGDGYCRCTIAAAELGQHGQYHWDMVLLAPGGSPESFVSGQFTV